MCMVKSLEVFAKLSQRIQSLAEAQNLLELQCIMTSRGAPSSSSCCHPMEQLEGCGPTLEAKIRSLFHEVIGNVARHIERDDMMSPET